MSRYSFSGISKSDADQLRDDLDCLAYCTRTEREAFKPSAHARNLAYEYCFDATQEFKDPQKQFYLLGIETDSGHPAKVTFSRDESDLANGLIVVQSKDEPPSWGSAKVPRMWTR